MAVRDFEFGWPRPWRRTAVESRPTALDGAGAAARRADVRVSDAMLQDRVTVGLRTTVPFAWLRLVIDVHRRLRIAPLGVDVFALTVPCGAFVQRRFGPHPLDLLSVDVQRAATDRPHRHDPVHGSGSCRAARSAIEA